MKMGRYRLGIEQIPRTTRLRARRRSFGVRLGRLSQPVEPALDGCRPLPRREGYFPPIVRPLPYLSITRGLG